MPRVAIEHLWLSLPVALVVWRGFLQPVRLMDFWWHLKAGEVIVTTGSIPRIDLFSNTAAGAPSVPHCWLAEVLFYLGYCVGGLPLLLAINALLLAAALVPVFHLCLEACGNLRLGVVAAMLAATSLALFSGMRPQVFSFVLFAVFYWVLVGYQKRRRDRLWLLPPLMALWVNLHGAFILGLGLIALFLGCESVRRLVHGPRPDTLSMSGLRRLSIILAVTIFASLLNPETYKIYAFVLDFGSERHSFIGEWQVPRVSRPEGMLTFFGPFFVILLALLYTRERPSLTELALFLLFAAFGLMAYRNGVWFSLIAAPILGRCLPTLWGRFRTSRCPANAARDTATVPRALGEGAGERKSGKPSYGSYLNPRSGRERLASTSLRSYLDMLIAAVLLLVTVLLSPWVYPHINIDRVRAGLLERETPIGAVDFIERNGLAVNIFHPQMYGDYLIWRLWPRQRSFLNSQEHLFDLGLLQEYMTVFGMAHWQDQLARHDIRFLLLSKNDRTNQMMLNAARCSPDWRLLYEDELSALFERAR